MPFNRIARAALLAGAAAASWWAVDQLLALRRQQYRAGAGKSAAKTAVQGWENEGGATLPPSTPAPATA